MPIIHKSKLPVGIEIDGKTIRDFTVRPAIVRDSVEVIEELGADCSQTRLRVAIEARQVSFDGSDIKLSVDMLLGMYDKDYAAITEAIDAVEKKLLAQSAS